MFKGKRSTHEDMLELMRGGLTSIDDLDETVSYIRNGFALAGVALVIAGGIAVSFPWYLANYWH
jgi:hypothetical protein